jgi:hypothetical protein
MPRLKPRSSPTTRLQHADSSSMLESFRAVGAAVVAAAAFETASRTLLPEGTWVELLAPIASAAGLLAACLYVITVKTEDASSGVRTVSRPPQRHAYRYGRFLRTFCRCGAGALVVILGIRLWETVPNALTGHSYVAGFVCSGSGTPVTSGTVDVLSRFDTVVSAATQRLDDRGFFYAQLEKWAMAPRSIQIIVPGCGGTQRLSLTTARTGACTSRSMAPDTRIDAREWTLSCEHK